MSKIIFWLKRDQEFGYGKLFLSLNLILKERNIKYSMGINLWLKKSNFAENKGTEICMYISP
jgi:hypothetical protein